MLVANPPVLFKEEAAIVSSVVVSKLIDTALIGKLLPVIITILPAGPFAGSSFKVGKVTAKADGRATETNDESRIAPMTASKIPVILKLIPE